MNYIFRVTLLLLVVSCDKAEVKPIENLDFSLNFLTLGISFPPVADQEQRDFTAPILSELNVGFIRDRKSVV